MLRNERINRKTGDLKAIVDYAHFLDFFDAVFRHTRPDMDPMDAWGYWFRDMTYEAFVEWRDQDRQL